MTSSHTKTALSESHSIRYLTDIFVIFKILSSEYRSYACGKIFHMPRSRSKMPSFRKGTMTGIASKVFSFYDRRACSATSDFDYIWTGEGI